MIANQQWSIAVKALSANQTIDEEHQRIIRQETVHWHKVLTRLLAITQFLAKNNMAFRGTSDVLYEKGNGNFLGLAELLGKFDPVMEEHLRRIQNGDTRGVTYLGKHIQNDLIEVTAKFTKNEILTRIKAAKYYSIILDCTPDLSKQEQLSFTIRFVDFRETNVSIVESFLGFVLANDCTGKGLLEILLRELELCGLLLDDCRGQGYDNGANMKGKNIGLQKLVRDLNSRAYFVPCGCHSLNLVLSDAAKSSVDTVTLFGTLQRVYVLFSGSVKRWKFFTDNVKGLTLKPLSNTRWEARIDAVRVLRYQLGEVHDALIELGSDKAWDDEICGESRSLANIFEQWEFIVSLVIWYDILFRVNTASKMMQSEKADMIVAMDVLNAVKSYLLEYRDSGLPGAEVTAKEIAEELGVSATYTITRRRKKKKFFSYEAEDESPDLPETLYRINFFLPLLDTAISSIDERFTLLQDVNENWHILQNFKNNFNRKDLSASCSKLQKHLSIGKDSDIVSEELCDEILCLKDILPENVMTPREVLQFVQIHNLQSAYPNVWVALKFFLTMPVSVASSERSFSKLKLIKTYLRSTMSQDRMSALAMIAIENQVASEINYDTLLKDFAAQKARKVQF